MLGLWSASNDEPWIGTGDDAQGIEELFLPDEHIWDTLLHVTAGLAANEALEWQSWCRIVPVDTRVKDKLSILPREEHLLAAIPHLEEICRDPRSHLTVEELRQPVGRARRFPPRSLTVLAMHSEDWHSRSLRTVKPKRILAELRDDDWAIYENRALRTLRGFVLTQLHYRIEQLRVLLAEVEVIGAPGVAGYRFRIDRLCNLLQEVFNDLPDPVVLGRILSRLVDAYSRLLSLEATFLFKALSKAPRVASPLQPTNILRADPHYKHIYALWLEWERTAEEEISRRGRLLQLCRSFDCFVALLVARACHVLRLDSEMTQSCKLSAGGQPVPLAHGWCIRWNPDATLDLIHSGVSSKLRIVGLPVQIGKLPFGDVRLIFDALEAEVKNNTSVLLVSLSSSAADLECLPSDLKTILSRAQFGRADVSGLCLVEASPIRLDAVELVARVIRMFVAHHDWPQMPLSICLPRDIGVIPEMANLDTKWTMPLPATVLNTLQRLCNEEMQRQVQLEVEKAKLRAQEAEALSLQGRERSRLLATVNNAKRELHAQEELSRTRARVLNELRRELDILNRRFAAVLSCPCCHQPTDTPPLGSLFACSSYCKTRWGRQDEDGVNIILIYPDGEVPTLPSDPVTRYGCDYV